MFDTQLAVTAWVEATVTLVVGTLITWLLGEAVRFLRTRVSVERQKELYDAAVWVVRYVEQEWQSGRIAKDMRLEEAVAALQQRVPWITPELGRQAVEAALRSLKEAMGVAAQPVSQPAAHSAVTFVRK
jgi:hypothetical protein